MAEARALTLITTNGAHEPLPYEPVQAENEKPKRERKFKPDDDELALEIAELWAKQVAFFYSQWHVYESGVWRARDEHQLRQKIRFLLRDKREQGIAVTQKQVSSLVRMLEGDFFKPDSELIERARLSQKYINLQNGLYNIETFQLEPHNSDLLFTTQLDFAYDPDADCPTFRRYLNTSLVGDDGKTDHSMIMLVMEALAYSMTARTDLKSSFWLVGKPDSGKSTLISFIRSLMGNLHTTIDLNQLATNRFLLSSIVGKRVVTFTEASEGSVLPDALYKAMVGGTDEIYADVKNRPGIAFVPQAKFWWAMNGAPRIIDRSGATLNRLRVILFNRTVPRSERIDNLPALLERERAGVFVDLMNAYHRLMRAGDFTRPEQSERWREEYRLENDTELTFVNECAKTGPTCKVQSDTLYRAYKEWCEEWGFRPKSKNTIGRDWERLGYVKTKSNGLMFWHGIQLKT